MKKVYIPPQASCFSLSTTDELLDFSIEVNLGEEGNQEEAESNMWQGAFEEGAGLKYDIWNE